MAFKLGFILSLTFVIQLLLITGDIAMIQTKQSHMQSFATVLGQRISMEGGLYPSHVEWALTERLNLVCLANCSPQFGDTLTFQLQTQIDPFILRNEVMTLRIVRHTVIGIYY